MKKNAYVLLSIVAGCVVVGLVFLLGPKLKPTIPQRFWAAKFSSDGQTLITVGGQQAPTEKPRLGEFIFWDVATGKKRVEVQQGSGVRGIDTSSNGKFVAMGDFGGATKLVQPDDGKVITTFPCRGPVNAVAISHDNKWVVSATLNGNVSIVDADSKQQELRSFPNESFLNVAVSPVRPFAALATRSGQAILIDLQRDVAPIVLQAYAGPPVPYTPTDAVAFAPDGLTIATGSRNNIRLWEPDTGKLIREFQNIVTKTNKTNLTGTNGATNGGSPPEKAEAARLTGIAFSQDGTTLATVDYGGTLALWNSATGECLKSIRAHSGPCYSICYSSDFKRIATVGRNDATVRIWDAQSLEGISSFKRAIRASHAK